MNRTNFYRFIGIIGAIVFLQISAAHAQIQIGTIRGAIFDENGAAIANAEIVLKNAVSNLENATRANENGEFSFNNLPLANYSLEISARGFASENLSAEVRSNVPLEITVKLRVADQNAVVEVASGDAQLINKFSASTETPIGASRIERSANALRGSGLQRLVATVPGATTQNNGLIHIRGVDNGLLYVVDGVPTADRVDSVSASSFDADDIASFNAITGNFPAEFGGRNAAIIQIQPKSGFGEKLFGSFSTRLGNFGTRDAAGSFGGGFDDKFGFYFSGAASRSNRYLDPVDERNFNNRGRRLNFNFRGDWHLGTKDIFIFNFGSNAARFQVPNDFAQQINGQNARQSLRDNNQSVSWERVWSTKTVTNLAFFRRDYVAGLSPSEFDTPISAQQNRRHSRTGVIGSLTQVFKNHIFKAGFEAERLTAREDFSFFITDDELAEERSITEQVRQFTPENPFVFRERRTGTYAAAYLQDSFTPLKNLTFNLGIRFDYSSLPNASRQFSPRVGVVYFIEKTNTAIRGSFNRLYQPPQIENLLLGNSREARALSPFAVETGGGAGVEPEKVSAYEIGFAQNVFGKLRFDAAYWHRDFVNFGDPNTFFNTTVIFPNSVARGFASGLDVRLDAPEYRGFSGFLSYTNARIVQFGPINGGLFLTDEFVEIGSGTRFVPDHDQRNVGAFGVFYNARRRGIWVSLGGRYESGVPLEADDDRLAELQTAPGADLVDFNRRRVKPWTTFDFAAGANLLQKEKYSLKLRFEMQNFTNNRYAYNFGSPFEGTHFGSSRIFTGGLKLEFR